MNQDIKVDDFRNALNVLIGATCWNTYSCGWEYSLRLAFGKAVILNVQKVETGEVVHVYRGQYELSVFCTWRLDDAMGNPVLGPASGRDAIVRSAVSFIGDKIGAIEIEPPVWEVTVRFVSGRQLRVFCDLIDSEESGTSGIPNWIFSNEEHRHIIGSDGIILREPRKNTMFGVIDIEDVDLEFLQTDNDYAVLVHLRQDKSVEKEEDEVKSNH